MIAGPSFPIANDHRLVQHKLVLSAYCTTVVLFHACLKLQIRVSRLHLVNHTHGVNRLMMCASICMCVCVSVNVM